MDDEQLKEEINKTTTIGCLIPGMAIVIFFCIVLIVSMFQSCGSQTKNPEWANRVNEQQIKDLSKSAIKQRFNYPSTVKFSSLNTDITYKEEDYDKDYYVLIYFNTCTAKNGFGLELKYKCWVTFKFDKIEFKYSMSTPYIEEY